MANQIQLKVTLNKEKLVSILKAKDLTVRGLGRDPDFKYSNKTIERAMRLGVISPTVLTKLATYLNVSIEYLSDGTCLVTEIYRYKIYTGGDEFMFHSVISTNESNARKVIREYMFTLFDEECIYIELRDILPIMPGTII